MTIRNLFYKIRFWLLGAPHASKVKEPSEYGMHKDEYKMNDVTIGPLPWYSSDYRRIYKKGTDPQFNWHCPWDYEGPKHSARENLVFTKEGMNIICRKESGYGTLGILYSNFSLTYGIIRAKIKLPKVKGGWSAFWTFAGMPEYDILEHCGRWDNKITTTPHWGYDYSGPYGKKSTHYNRSTNRKFKPTEEYYIYELETTPYKVIWRINGRIVRVMKEGIQTMPTNILFTVSKGDYCGSVPFGKLPADATMNVEWLKVYTRGDSKSEMINHPRLF